MKKLLDFNGLRYFYSKMKALIDNAINKTNTEIQVIKSKNAMQDGKIASINQKIDDLNITMGGGLLFNGDFQIWQRGIVFEKPNNIYTADRIKIENGVDANVLVKRDSPKRAGHKYSCRVEGAFSQGGQSAYTDAVEYIEDLENLRGRVVTFTVEMQIDSGIRANMFIATNLGTTSLGSVIGDGTLKKYSIKRSIASNPTVLQAIVRLERTGLSVGKGLNIQTRKLEIGKQSTKFYPETYGKELRNCQRYFEKSYHQESFPGSKDRANEEIYKSHNSYANGTPGGKFVVTKRGWPKITIYDSFHGNIGKVWDHEKKIHREVGIYASGDRQFWIDIKDVPDGHRLTWQWTAESEI